jgi:phosphate transport system ATP-binding protein
MGQAERISDETAFFLSGKLIEIGTTHDMFHNSKNEQTRDYISGKFG